MNPTDLKGTHKELNYTGLAITFGALILVAIFVDLDSVKVWIERAGVWGPLIFVAMKISTIVFAPLSGSPLYPLVGLIFGFWPGILYVVIGDFLGYTISFYISRFFGRKIVNKFIANKEEGLLSRIVEHISTQKGFLQACLTLFPMPELLSYGAGLSRLSYMRFILTLMPLSILAASILVFFGSILSPSGGSLLITLGLPLVAVVVILIGGYFFSQAVVKKGD